MHRNDGGTFTYIITIKILYIYCTNLHHMYRRIRPLAPDGTSFNNPPVDGKTKASFITYQRLTENSLATWWRNVFLMSNVAIATSKSGFNDQSLMCATLLSMSCILLAWSTYSFWRNSDKIVKAAAERGLSIERDWSWGLAGVVFCIMHGWITTNSWIFYVNNV